MRDYEALLETMLKPVMERLTDPKNVAKGDFPDDPKEIMDLFYLELNELEVELGDLLHSSGRIDRIIYEASDVIVCLSFLIKKCTEIKNNS